MFLFSVEWTVGHLVSIGKHRYSVLYLYKAIGKFLFWSSTSNKMSLFSSINQILQQTVEGT